MAEEQRCHVSMAFLRGEDVLVAVSRWTVRLGDSGWEDTTVALPEGEWIDVLSNAQRRGTVPAGELFAEMSVALLVRADA